jgi:hypothetical protein
LFLNPYYRHAFVFVIEAVIIYVDISVVLNRKENGTQEDQRVRLQEIVEGAFQEVFWS